MKKSELKQLIRETVEEVRVISEANKIAAYLKSNPRLVKSLMAHGVLTEADMGRRDFLKKMGMGLAAGGLTAAGMKAQTTASSAHRHTDLYRAISERDFRFDLWGILRNGGLTKTDVTKTGLDIEDDVLGPFVSMYEDMTGGQKKIKSDFFKAIDEFAKHRADHFERDSPMNTANRKIWSIIKEKREEFFQLFSEHMRPGYFEDENR